MVHGRICKAIVTTGGAGLQDLAKSGNGEMAEFPALPLWTDAYLGDTAHLTNEEHGVYLRLLMFAWRSPDCCLPDDDRRLAIMTGMTDKKWRAIRPVIAAFWTIGNGTWTQKRLTKERDFVKGKSEKNRDAAKARWNGKPLKTNDTSDANAMPAHMPEPCQTDAPTPIPTPMKKERDKSLSSAHEGFQDFWDQYPHRNGAKKGRQAAEKSWIRQVGSGVSREAIIGGALRYATDRQVVQGYAKDPATWLNQRGWEDDIEPDSTTGTHQRRAGGSHDSMVAAFAHVASRQ